MRANSIYFDWTGANNLFGESRIPHSTITITQQQLNTATGVGQLVYVDGIVDKFLCIKIF